MIRLTAVVVACSWAGAVPAPAQTAPAYAATLLHCSRYDESARSEVETETAGRVRRARAEREGSWSFRARDTAGGVLLEGWYDALAVRHGSGDTLIAPDTDGIIGGRYRGLLAPTGEYQRLASPFVPDEVAEAVDAAAALDELLPRLPVPALAEGERWRDGEGLEIERIPDSTAGRRLQRYRLRRRTEAAEAIPRGDTVPVPMRQSAVEDARIVWDPEVGLVRHERETVIDAAMPAGGRIRAPVRSRVVQRGELVRMPSTGRCR